jgi:uncharacterized protein (TIGR00369 family)
MTDTPNLARPIDNAQPGGTSATHAPDGFGPAQLEAEGPFAGWMTWGLGRDPFESFCGPFYQQEQPDGSMLCAFTPRPEHRNGSGALHGGALMSFADFALFGLAWPVLKDGTHAVTVGFNADFVGAAHAFSPVYARGEVIRNTRSLIFVQARLEQDNKPVLAFSGTLKKITPKS